MDFIVEGFIQAFRLLFSMDEETMNILFTTLRLTALSMGGILLMGLPLGFILGYFDFPGKRCVRTAVDTLLALPTVVIGLLVYAFISRRGPSAAGICSLRSKAWRHRTDHPGDADSGGLQRRTAIGGA